jgi:hypothetical protein
MIPADKFVIAWQTSSSIKEVQNKIGGNANNLYQRAYRYRKLGIPLKHFYSATDTLDVERLTELAKSHAEGGDNDIAPACPFCGSPLVCPNCDTKMAA